MVFVVELVLVVKLISWSLSDAQPVPTRLTTVAAVVHVFLVLGLGLVAGEVFAAMATGLS
jgi:hypothetical protein